MWSRYKTLSREREWIYPDVDAVVAMFAFKTRRAQLSFWRDACGTRFTHAGDRSSF